jgi:hypothetical protein
MRQRFILTSGGLFLGVVFALSGCQQPEDKGTKPAKEKGGEITEKAEAKDKHDSWWCAEHGIPEEECSLCSDKVAKECKARGDWCEKHDRAKSQCFICDPSLQEKFAARYRAKYGKEPPPIAKEEDEKKDGEKKGKD